MPKLLLLIVFSLSLLAGAFAFQTVVWWTPAGGGPCPNYNTKADCEKAEKKTCVMHTGTAGPACAR